MFGMFQGIRGMPHGKKSLPLKSASLISKQQAQIYFIVGVVVTSDMMSQSIEFQSDSLCGRWVTDWLNLYNVHTCKILMCSDCVLRCALLLNQNFGPFGL